MTNLIDTNILVYAFDPRDRHKQAIAERVLRDGQAEAMLLLAHQVLVEFVAATTRPVPELQNRPLLSREQALDEVERLFSQFPVLWPDRPVLVTALRGFAAYGLSWYDAHLWAYAEANGIPEILSEDFEHGRYYGSVRIMNPFLQEQGGVHELPPMYDTA